MDNKVVKSVLGAVALSGAAYAGPVQEVTPEAASGCGDWCACLTDLGNPVYEGNGIINKVQFFGRAHANYGITTGDVNGVDFDGSDYLARRLRLGVKIDFLQNAQLVVSANLLDDNNTFGDARFGYSSLDVFYLKYNFGNILGLENASVKYGRMKHKFGAEGHTSSNNLKTVERSVIGNYFYGGARPTGIKAEADFAGFHGAIGVFSTDIDTELGNWDDGIAYYASLSTNVAGGTLLLDGLYNDISAGDQDVFGMEWALSAAYTTQLGNWTLLTNLLYSEEHNGDNTFGVVIMPSTYIVPDKVEFVARYEFGDSDNTNRLGLSQFAAAQSGAGLGNERHALYVGLNYHLCGNNARLQAGIEYETAEDTLNADADATTFWFGFKSHF